MKNQDKIDILWGKIEKLIMRSRQLTTPEKADFESIIFADRVAVEGYEDELNANLKEIDRLQTEIRSLQ